MIRSDFADRLVIDDGIYDLYTVALKKLTLKEVLTIIYRQWRSLKWKFPNSIKEAILTHSLLR
ncbi:MAG: hypothetical protein ACU833_00310 [Gammaproteobacteria bacterium]